MTRNPFKVGTGLPGGAPGVDTGMNDAPGGCVLVGFPGGGGVTEGGGPEEPGGCAPAGDEAGGGVPEGAEAGGGGAVGVVAEGAGPEGVPGADVPALDEGVAGFSEPGAEEASFQTVTNELVVTFTTTVFILRATVFLGLRVWVDIAFGGRYASGITEPSSLIAIFPGARASDMAGKSSGMRKRKLVRERMAEKLLKKSKIPDPARSGKW